MNILFHYDGFDPAKTDRCGGAARMIFTVAKHLAKKATVCIASELVKATGKVDGVNVFRLPVSKTCDYSPFDVVIFVCGGMHLRSKKPKGQRWVRWEHCWDFPPCERSDKLDTVIAVSLRHGEHLIASGVPRAQVAVLPNCVDTSLFKYEESIRPAGSCMFVGRVVEGKGIDIACSAVNNDRVLSLDVFGEYGVVPLASCPRVKFYGPIPQAELTKQYLTHEYLLLPSHTESFGLVLAEAQCCGCIPIAALSGGVAEVVDNGVSGHKYLPNDVATLGRILREVRLGALPDIDRQAMAEAARAKYDPEITYAAAERIFL